MRILSWGFDLIFAATMYRVTGRAFGALGICIPRIPGRFSFQGGALSTGRPNPEDSSILRLSSRVVRELVQLSTWLDPML